MTDWKLVKVSDIGQVVTGNTPPRKNPEFYGDHTIFIKPTDISEDQKYTRFPEECYSELGYKKYQRSLIPLGSTCVVTIGSIGKKITKAHCECFINQAMNAVIPTDDFDQEFVYYVLRYNLPQLKTLDSGTASGRENVSKSSFSNLSLYVPKSKTVQALIGSTLSAYDTMIEVNQKRIKLLEELALRTYEEWFVKFLISGVQLPLDENTGLPHSWKMVSLSSLGDFLNGFAFKPSDFHDSGIPIVKIKEMKNGILPDTPKNDGSRVPSKFLIKSGDILFSWSATLEVVLWQHGNGWLNQHLFKVTPKKHIPRVFLYQTLLKSLEIFNNLTTGATMKHIKRKELDFVQVVIPDIQLLISYDKYMSPVIEQILTLSKQNSYLTETREVLLPILMNGTIKIDES